MLYEIFNQMKKHTSLYGQTSFSCVSQYFGKDTMDRPSSYPRVIWMPSSDEYVSPNYAALPQIIGGKHVQQESLYSRKCGCDLHLYHKDYPEMEKFINDLHMALDDVCGAIGTSGNIGNVEISSGRWINKEDVSLDSVGYVQSIYVYVPIYRLKPAAILENTTVTLT